MPKQNDQGPSLDKVFLLLSSFAIGFAVAATILLIVNDPEVQGLTNITIFLSFIMFIMIVTRMAIRGSRQTYLAKQLATEMAGDNIRLERIDKMKSEFVSIASHQLRSPLTTIRGSVSMILEGTYGEISPKVREILERVEDTSRAMSLAVADYLNVSRIESGTLSFDLKEVDLCELVEDVVMMMKSVGKEKGHTLTLVTNNISTLMVEVDVGKTRQIIQNLIDNAFKYTEGTSGIKVVMRTDKSKSVCYIDIVDHGIGIDPDEINKLFNKFARAKNANTVNVTGTGLGLYIARKMALAMGGDIVVKSKGLGQGSTFTVSLPLYNV